MENNDENLVLRSNVEPNTISFNIETLDEPILKLCANGDIFVKGKLVENDLEVVEGLREFLRRVK